VRQALCLACKAAFFRASVSFFGASPWKHDSICYYDASVFPEVKGYVALTIDDAPNRLGREASMLPEVMELLRKHDASATFMVMGKFVEGNEADLVDLLRDGHELGNHGMVDRPYHKDSNSSFSEAVEECSCRIRALQREAQVMEDVRWFRAPHGKYTSEMSATLQQKGLTNVMCDTYACCPVIQDSNFIGGLLAERANHGSIILIHMPEKGFRDWCFVAMQRLLEDLNQRGLRVVTVSELARRADSLRVEEPSPNSGHVTGSSAASDGRSSPVQPLAS